MHVVINFLIKSASRKEKYRDDTINTLGFAQRAKKIKNEVSQNVVLSQLEYKYLTEALIQEVLILRSDLSKSGIPIHIVTDEKVLEILPNNFSQNTKQIIDNNDMTDDLLKYKSLSTTSTTTNKRKTGSIKNLDEEQIIIKYCELKAKFENLKEKAGRRISELKSGTYRKSLIPVAIPDDDFNRKSKEIIEENEKKIDELNSKLEHEASENREKITNLSDELEKVIEENKRLKAENLTLRNDLKLANDSIDYFNSNLEFLKNKHETSSNIISIKYRKKEKSFKGRKQ